MRPLCDVLAAFRCPLALLCSPPIVVCVLCSALLGSARVVRYSRAEVRLTFHAALSLSLSLSFLGRSMVLSDKQKMDRLKRAAARSTPETSKSGPPAGVLLKQSGGAGVSKAIERSAVAVVAKSVDKDATPRPEAAPADTTAAPKPQEAAQASPEAAKSSAISKEVLTARGKSGLAVKSEEAKVESAEAAEDEPQSSEKAEEEVKSARKPAEETKAAPVKPAKAPSSAKPVRNSSASASKASAAAPARSAAKPLNKRKVSAAGARKRPKKKSATRSASKERSLSPTVMPPEDGTALISGESLA